MNDRAFEPAKRRQPAFRQLQLKILKVMFAQRQVSQEVVTAALRVGIGKAEFRPSRNGLLLDNLMEMAESFYKGVRPGVVAIFWRDIHDPIAFVLSGNLSIILGSCSKQPAESYPAAGLPSLPDAWDTRWTL
jgi:hypothetical protein